MNNLQQNIAKKQPNNNREAGKAISDGGQFACSVCKIRFKQLSQLRNHSVLHMNKEFEVVPIWSSKKKCELCGKFLADSKCLKKHIQAVHSKLKP